MRALVVAVVEPPQHSPTVAESKFGPGGTSCDMNHTPNLELAKTGCSIKLRTFLRKSKKFSKEHQKFTNLWIATIIYIV